MAIPRVLSRPPITEALIDLRTAVDSAIDAARLQGLRTALQADYPNVEERHQVQAQFRFQDGGLVLPPAENLFHGLFFRTTDGLRIAQFRRDGFTLNQLAPYANADVLIAEALRLWHLYRDAVQPAAISRVACRYINSLRLPYGPRDDFRRFLTAAPNVPAEAPQSVSSFLSRVMAHEGDDVVILTHKLEDAIPGEPIPVTLDIDVFRPGAFSAEGQELLGILERLRQLKNRVFFASLTDEAVELFI